MVVRVVGARGPLGRLHDQRWEVVVAVVVMSVGIQGYGLGLAVCYVGRLVKDVVRALCVFTGW